MGKGGSCNVHRMGDTTLVRCPNGLKGTLTVYRNRGESAACEVDFWYQGSAAGNGPWRAQLSHQNASSGTCTTHWTDPSTLQLTIQSPQTQ